MRRFILISAGIVAFSAGAIAVVTATPQLPTTRLDPRLLAPSVRCLDSLGNVIKLVPNPLLALPTISDQDQAGIC
ncbi:MAG: hypothetical protein ACYDCC_03775 [Actinomycetota bacterium]